MMLLDERICVESDHRPVFRDQIRKFVKGACDMFNVFKIVKMIRIDVQDDFDFRIET